jgi:hypothetical protein
VFKDRHNLPTNSGIACILYLDSDRHVFCIVQSGQAATSLLQKRSKDQARYAASNSPLDGGNGSQTEVLKKESGDSPSSIRADHLVKCFFTIPDEKDVRRRMLGDQACGSKEGWGKEIKAVTSVML